MRSVVRFAGLPLRLVKIVVSSSHVTETIFLFAGAVSLLPLLPGSVGIAAAVTLDEVSYIFSAVGTNNVGCLDSTCAGNKPVTGPGSFGANDSYPGTFASAQVTSGIQPAPFADAAATVRSSS